jgi:hypothetical protein
MLIPNKLIKYICNLLNNKCFIKILFLNPNYTHICNLSSIKLLINTTTKKKLKF